MRNGQLEPDDDTSAAAISTAAKDGCVSCHADLRTVATLQPADAGAYHWPEGPEAQAACQTCHKDAEGRLLPLRAIAKDIPVDRRKGAVQFPHDVHVGGASFGKGGKLAAGCFACHEFAAPTEGRPYQQLPMTKPEAKDCTACHQGHDNVGGGACRVCHPAEAERSNSFLIASKLDVGAMVGGRAVPELPTREWPAPNGFSHLSPGHSGDELTCAACHDGFGLEQAKTLGAVRVPDEQTKLCRDCHLQKQFHWR
jgi:hypothetical protein